MARASVDDIFPEDIALQALGYPSQISDVRRKKVTRLRRQAVRWLEQKLNTYLTGREIQLDCIVRESDRRVFVTGQDFLEVNPQRFFNANKDGIRYHDLKGYVDLNTIQVTGIAGTGNGGFTFESLKQGTSIVHQITATIAPSEDDIIIETMTVTVGLDRDDVIDENGNPTYKIVQPCHVAAMEDYIGAQETPQITDDKGHHPLMRRANDLINEGEF